MRELNTIPKYFRNGRYSRNVMKTVRHKAKIPHYGNPTVAEDIKLPGFTKWTSASKDEIEALPGLQMERRFDTLF